VLHRAKKLKITDFLESADESDKEKVKEIAEDDRKRIELQQSRFEEDMKTSGRKLPKGKLERLKNAMNRALKGVRRIAVMFNKAMAQSGEDIKIGKTSVYKILVEYGILGIKKERRYTVI
jgi:hypothetical protein